MCFNNRRKYCYFAAIYAKKARDLSPVHFAVHWAKDTHIIGTREQELSLSLAQLFSGVVAEEEFTI